MRIMIDLDLGEHIGRGMRRIMKVLTEKDFEITENFITITFRYNDKALKMLDPQMNSLEVESNLSEQEQIIIN